MGEVLKDIVVPDMIEAIRAYRLVIKKKLIRPTYRPLHMIVEEDYEVGRWYDAICCVKDRVTQHDAPDPDCMCGFYSLKAIEQFMGLRNIRYALSAAEQSAARLVEVDIAGRVIEGEFGYRSGRMKIVEVYSRLQTLNHFQKVADEKMRELKEACNEKR